MDLTALADFHLVAVQGGFRRASLASGRPRATLSRRVAELETSLGVRLFERGSRSLRLTDEGRVLHAQTQSSLNDINAVGEALRGGLAGPSGRLRVNTPVLFGNSAMGRIAAEFSRDFPQVELEVTAEDRFIDPVEEGFDVVIRVNPRPDEQLVGRCFLRDSWLLVAPAWLGRPSPENKTSPRIPAVVRTSSAELDPWRIVEGERQMTFRPEPVLRLSSMTMIRDAVTAGAGAALLPQFIVADCLKSGEVVTWGTYVGYNVEVWVLHTSRRLVSRKVSAFVQFLLDAFPNASLEAEVGGIRV